MTAKDVLLLNFQEIRRRSIKVWQAIPEDMLHWKPDSDAMSCIEMVRHVLEGENIYHHIVLTGGALNNFDSPLRTNPFVSIEEELRNAQPYRERFLQMVNGFLPEELEEHWIVREEPQQKRKLGDYLLRIGYHESVHCGQMLTYLRLMGLPRPSVWD
jgi:uncharacterized damage-inducible protein DinB